MADVPLVTSDEDVATDVLAETPSAELSPTPLPLPVRMPDALDRYSDQGGIAALVERARQREREEIERLREQLKTAYPSEREWEQDHRS